ncbi:hypothetical protein ACIBAC_00430 [Streptomyces sp. NPDC051362]|uniref:hypothetical protein n=1 Tax=Streptomyces sp. NPDC051362 TaxID=3365651 RepID=UPI003787A7DF
MSRLTDPTGVRVARRVYHVRVESTTARDSTISFRALGLLTYLLDQKEGWQVRSDQLSKGEGREGREAVRTALRELAAKGYYRLERRRLRTGKVVMGTSVAEYPVPQWVADHAVFSAANAPAVPVVEQADGSFLVEYPDGTLGSDGFEPDPRDEEPPAPAEEEAEQEAPTASEEPPAAPTRRPRRTSEQKAADDAKTQAEKDEKAAEKAELDAAAEEVAKWWWEEAEKRYGPYAGGNNAYVALRKQIRNALAKKYTKNQCGKALIQAAVHWPSAQQWQRALGIVTNRNVPTRTNGAVPYNDAATWGNHGETPPGTPDSHEHDDSDDATFGVVNRMQGV